MKIILTLACSFLVSAHLAAQDPFTVEQYLFKADEALKEVQGLIQQKEAVNKIQRAVARHNRALNNALVSAKKNQKEQARKAYKDIQLLASRHVGVLQSLAGQVPPELKKAIESAIARSERGRNIAERQLKKLGTP